MLIKLRYKFLNIAWISLTTFPLLMYAFKESVGIIEFASLKLDHPLGILPDQEAYDVTWTRIMRAIEVPFFWRQFVVAAEKVAQAFGVHAPNRLWQVAVHLWIFKVEDWRFEIFEDPRVDWVLGQVLGGPLRVGVANFQIVVIREFAGSPLFCILQNWRVFCLAIWGQIAKNRIINSVPLLLWFKCQIKGPRRIRIFIKQYQLQASVSQFKASLEKLSELFYRKRNYLFIV